MLLKFMIISLFMVKVEKVWLWKSLNEAIFWDGGSTNDYSHMQTQGIFHF
jgi:hypothetical protein